MAKGHKVADGTVKDLAARAELATADSSLEQIFLEITGHGPQFAPKDRDVMVLATLYIMWCSAKNRMRRRLRRLREPRYLIGAIVGAAYLFFALYGRTRPRARRLPASDQSPGARQAQSVIAVVRRRGALARWACAARGGGRQLADAVWQRSPRVHARPKRRFLFPAPVARRQLLFYRLMRSQWAVFFRRPRHVAGVSDRHDSGARFAG